MRKYIVSIFAEVARNDFIKNADAMKRRKNGKVPSLKEAVAYWLQSKVTTVQPTTHHAYTQVAHDYIVGPIFKGTQQEKYQYAMTGKKPEGAQLVPMLGGEARVDEITTAEIRLWYQRLLAVSSTYNAKLAKKHLSSIFRLIEEDYEVRLAEMTGLSRAAISFIESGKRNPTLVTCLKIAKALDLDLGDIITHRRK